MPNQTAATKGVAYYTNLNNVITSNFVLVSSSIGIPLNLLSILVSLRLMNKKNNMGFLYIFQSLADLIMFLVYLLLIRSRPLIFTYALENQSNFMCKLLRFLRKYSHTLIFVDAGYNHVRSADIRLVWPQWEVQLHEEKVNIGLYHSTSVNCHSDS